MKTTKHCALYSLTIFHFSTDFFIIYHDHVISYPSLTIFSFYILLIPFQHLLHPSMRRIKIACCCHTRTNNKQNYLVVTTQEPTTIQDMIVAYDHTQRLMEERDRLATRTYSRISCCRSHSSIRARCHTIEHTFRGMSFFIHFL